MEYTVIVKNLDDNCVCVNVYDTFDDACTMAETIRKDIIVRAHVLRHNVLDARDKELLVVPAAIVSYEKPQG